MISITGLPQNVNEEMLYDIFRLYGKLLEVKINKEYYESHCAIIEFADEISVHQILFEQKEFKINNNILKVSLYDEHNNDEFRTVYLYVNNFPSDITQEQLSIFFEQFGPVFNCKIKQSKQSNHKSQLQIKQIQSSSGFVEYQSFQTIDKTTIIYIFLVEKVNLFNPFLNTYSFLKIYYKFMQFQFSSMFH